MHMRWLQASYTDPTKSYICVRDPAMYLGIYVDSKVVILQGCKNMMRIPESSRLDATFRMH